jgi:Na+/H+ antiporter NhaB
MIKKGVTYNSISLLYQLKQLIIIFLVLLIVAIPLVNIITLISESKYELYENLAKENTEEKKEDSREDEKIDHSVDFKTSTFLALSHDYFNSNCSHLSFNPDIHLPPPKL